MMMTTKDDFSLSAGSRLRVATTTTLHSTTKLNVGISISN
jgi:hypothetical protein